MFLNASNEEYRRVADARTRISEDGRLHQSVKCSDMRGVFDSSQLSPLASFTE